MLHGYADFVAVGIVSAAGFLRGVTGFGGALLMTPLLSILFGPVPAVVIALVLEITAALVMFPNAIPRARWRLLSFLTLPAILTVPLGSYLLLHLDPPAARRTIAITVIVCSAALLLGLRYSGSPRPVTSLALGSIVGLLLGATSVGAPPVILYLLSGPDPAAVTRANLTIFITTISVVGVMMLAAAGVLTAELAASAAILATPFMFATWIGGKMFTRLSDAAARRIALILMMAAGILGAFA